MKQQRMRAQNKKHGVGWDEVPHQHHRLGGVLNAHKTGCSVAKSIPDSTQMPTQKASPASWVWWGGVWYGQIGITSFRRHKQRFFSASQANASPRNAFRLGLPNCLATHPVRPTPACCKLGEASYAFRCGKNPSIGFSPPTLLVWEGVQFSSRPRREMCPTLL